MPFPLLLIPVAIVGAITYALKGSQSSSRDREYDGPCVEPESGSDSYSGRWTQNEINVRDNINAGMAVKDD
jgi:hypothetical protein